jgi:hypothetical protein
MPSADSITSDHDREPTVEELKRQLADGRAASRYG